MALPLELSGSSGKIHLIPIKLIQFDGVNIDDYDLWIWDLEAESSYSIAQYIRNDDRGMQRVLGYQVQATIYVPHNDYKNNGMLERLNWFCNKSHVTNADSAEHIHIMLNSGGSKGAMPPVGGLINATDLSQQIFLCNLNGNVGVNWEIESVQWRPRLKITINAFQKNLTDLIN
ncbi:MAG TPA: hypothetical protein PLC04_04160 [Candidatus Kapabacteria bacterium]|nr:hypothetical protein [Candidatus Kapabacteria bacterium]